MNVIQCVLYLQPPDSQQMKNFLIPTDDTIDDITEWEKELVRVKTCFKYGGDLHSDLIWIILESTENNNGIDANLAINILEQLFHRCGRSRRASLHVDDPKIIWELYNLVIYTPGTHDKNLTSDFLMHVAANDEVLEGLPRCDCFIGLIIMHHFHHVN